MHMHHILLPTERRGPETNQPCTDLPAFITVYRPSGNGQGPNIQIMRFFTIAVLSAVSSGPLGPHCISGTQLGSMLSQVSLVEGQA